MTVATPAPAEPSAPAAPAASPAAAAAAAAAPPAPAPAAGAPASSGVALDGKPPPEPSSLVSAAKPPEGEKPAPGEENKPALDYTGLKLPEDFKINEERLTEFKTLATELNIPPEGAQKLVNLYAAEIKKAAVDEPQKAWEDMQTEWKQSVSSDPEVGGDKLGPTLASISKAIDSVGGKDAQAIREAFDMTGAGNNPALIKFVARLARSVSEGTTVSGNPPGGKSGRSPAEVLYPQQTSQ